MRYIQTWCDILNSLTKQRKTTLIILRFFVSKSLHNHSIHFVWLEFAGGYNQMQGQGYNQQGNMGPQGNINMGKIPKFYF